MKKPKVIEHKVTMKVLDRLTLSAALPANGDVATMRHVEALRKRLDFSDAEAKRLRFREGGAGVLWDQDADGDKLFKFNGADIAMIVLQLQDLQDTKKMTTSHLSLWGKFMENGVEE